MRISRLVLLVATLSSGCWTYAQAPASEVWVVSGRGMAIGEGKAGTRPLKKGDKLFAGERVICAAGCKELVINYCNVKVPVPRGPKGRLIVSINCSALEGPRGGAPKGETVAIISPKESELIRPETFSIRWKQYVSQIKLRIKVYLGGQIWGPERVNGSTGSFTSVSLKTALKNAQKDGNLHLILTLDARSEPTQRVKFDLIPIAGQEDMNKKLAAVEGENNYILKALRRGMIFSEYDLYTDAVGEFEKALARATSLKADEQNLMELRNFAIMANYKAYNDDRARQLCESLNLPTSSLPDICSRLKQ